MPESVPADVRETWHAVGGVLDERARQLAESARTGTLDRDRLRAIDDRLVHVIGGVAAARDVCDATAEAPLVLLPVRLETRFAADEAGRPALKVRIYPDEVHVDSLDRGVDEEEAAAARAWWNAQWTASDPLPPEPWSQFVAAVGEARAGGWRTP